MSLPSPKEMLKSVARVADTAVEAVTAPAKQLASALNLPPLPEPPKAEQVVESLPELPLPTAPSGAGAGTKTEVGAGQVTKMKLEEKPAVKEAIKLKII
ncbi:MAG: hypothetical protein LZ173_02150 [Thaumarchaeota archaeon]|jgi:hypothetical protein|nr:hypothetical protein [Candidatus Geocrenenecus arthurdayi]